MKKANVAIASEENTATASETNIDQNDMAVEEKVAVKPKKERQKLDRDRAFGMISGEIDGYPGACYAQDGNFYDSNGDNLING